MTALLIAGGIVFLLVIFVAAAILAGRMQKATYDRKLREAITAYAAARGGSVTFDAQGMIVRGPLGEGRERLTALSIMCAPNEESRWSTSIGFVLRKYIPDAFDEAFAKAAAESLAKARPLIDALSDEELGQKLRAGVFARRASDEGLTTCARPLGKRFELRIMLDGFDLAGVPSAVRGRFKEPDPVLLERAIDATLGDPLPAAEGKAEPLAWLARPARLCGATPHLLACEGKAIAWVAAAPGLPENEIANLASRSLTSGPMKGVMFGWDGATLSEIGVVAHSIIGPTTPDYTLELAPSMAKALGVTTAADGTIGIRRR